MLQAQSRCTRVMRRSAATSRASSIIRASPTATRRSSARRSGFARRATSARAKSSPTTTGPTASGIDPVPLPAGLQGHALMRVLYLHGFASSAQSSKARFFRERLRAHGVEVVHSGLQRAGLLDAHGHADARAGAGCNRHAARAGRADRLEPRRHSSRSMPRRGSRPVDRMVLLAPALDFGGNRMRDLGDRGLDEWRRTDTLTSSTMVTAGWCRSTTSSTRTRRRYDAFDAAVEQPVLIFQGARDTAVDPATVERWRAPAERRAAPARRRSSAADAAST